MEKARSVVPDTVCIQLRGNSGQAATIVDISLDRVFKYLTKAFIEDTLTREVDSAVAEWQTGMLIHPEINLLKKAALCQLINSEQVQKTAIEAIAVVLDA